MSRVFMNAANNVIENLNKTQAACARACLRAGRRPEDVNLMAVTKYAADQDVLTLLESGRIRHIGESRVQQAAQRWTKPSFAKYNISKHFIGHLQKNKAAQAAKLFDFIDSIDDIDTALRLNACARALNKTLGVLVQIKLTDRQTQSGVSFNEAPLLVQELKKLDFLCPCGYMAIAPKTDNPQSLRGLFKKVREAFERDFPPQLPQRFLSLGMSEDFETAVEEGSTLPRVGSKLFASNLEGV